MLCSGFIRRDNSCLVIGEVMGSNLMTTYYSDLDTSFLPSAPPGEFTDIRLKYSMVASFHISTN